MPPDSGDPFHLQRFVDAQDGIYEEACSELRAGFKRGHWMWFVFPQIQGLGQSFTARRFGISSPEEAGAFLEHVILGPRLRECTRIVNSLEGRSAEQIFGYEDAMKFRSCMTLFAHATSDNQLFQDALQKFFGGRFDPLTIERL